AWSWDATADPTATQPYAPNGTITHNFSQTHQYTTAGCNHTATVKITDKDGGSDTKMTTVGVGTGAFLPPMTNQPVTNKLKNGQTLPAKVQITDCRGAGFKKPASPMRPVAGSQATTCHFRPPTAAGSPSPNNTTRAVRSSG